MTLCRLCLDDNMQEHISLLNNPHSLEKIENCLPIKIREDDDLPTTVCQTCLQKVEDWHSFREMCLSSQESILKGKYKNLSVFEDNDDIDDIKFLLTQEETDKNNGKVVENKYICEICKKDFNTCVEYLDHQSFHDGQLVFNCDKCAEVFSSRDQLVEHDRNHRNPCPKCGKFILKSSMKLHLIKHTDRHKCTLCSGRFNSRAALQQHTITIHTGRRDHICETCGKRFSSKTALNVHLQSHSDERLYRCKLCDYAGNTASAVYVHMSKHANEVCTCELCSKVFKSNRNLNDHLRRVHSKDKKHRCPYCDKRFVDKYMVTVHVRCHTGVRPYGCQLCNKRFIRSDGLKEHMAIHGERTWYSCDECCKKFASKKGLTRHRCKQTTIRHDT